ncbi:MAG: hypothetical protein JW395_0739 [Nitrospira sp.]|nr:hypothetical protein [Nitrospira sp.]
MRTIEVGKLDQLHFAWRMRGHLTHHDFVLAIQSEWHGGGRRDPEDGNRPYNRTDCHDPLHTPSVHHIDSFLSSTLIGHYIECVPNLLSVILWPCWTSS